MPISKKLTYLRVVERLLFILMSGIILVMIILSVDNSVAEQELFIGGSAIAGLLLIIIFLQYQIDRRVSILLAQANFTGDSAFLALFERSPVAYVIIDRDGRVNRGNQAAVRLLRSKRDDLSQINFFSLIKKDADSEVNPDVIKGKVSAGITLTDIELPLETMLNQTIWVLFSVFPYQREDERLVSLVDVTDQKHIDVAKSEFVALATHQLRTPIAAIRWNVELLEKKLQKGEPEAAGQYLERINRNISRTINLINDFLSVSKLEMGTYASDPVQINMPEFCASILDEFNEKITDKQIKLVINYDPQELVVSIDKRLLHIIVSNLFSNAVKYIELGGALELSYAFNNDQLEIVVADDGIGIPESELENLFSKFYRASNAQSQHTEGTGLGLYIVRQSAEQIGGSVQVTSAENQGAKFTVRLPVSVV